jgi:hypothetical protein
MPAGVAIEGDEPAGWPAEELGPTAALKAGSGVPARAGKRAPHKIHPAARAITRARFSAYPRFMLHDARAR